MKRNYKDGVNEDVNFFTGIEIDKQYYDASEKLFKQHSSQTRLF
jgi:hypothetical protein